MKFVARFLAAVLVVSQISACGGGSSTPASSASGSTPPAQVQGVATPKSVSVVTAN
jgi:hypothetical protein